ncbi:TPA: hypothetical protein QCY70_004905 [Bacillus cereus]|nr:hypothetical protein [Bacillus cereus]HDR8014937.1 hypothetical protein [Bacillus cereus]
MTTKYTGLAAIERMQTHWINCCKGCWKMEGNSLLHKYYGEEEITKSDMHLFFFFENEFVDYEEPLKVGDWVVHDKYIVKVTEILDSTKYRCDYISIMRDQILDTKYIQRKATDEEIDLEKRRRLFEKVGRKMDEFKEGDVVVICGGDLAEIVEVLDPLKRVKCKQWDDHNNMFSKFNIKPQSLKLVVPVEQRLDNKDK